MRGMKHYRIMGTYRGRTEEIDSATSEKDARYLLAEYRLAFGSAWKVWVEECSPVESP
jgi:hypothetical protein